MKKAEKKAANKARKTILIVDDHPITRQGLRELLRHESDLAVFGEAENAHEALAALKPAQPDLVLADLTLEGKGGLELIKDLRVQHPEVAVLVVSMHDESIYAERVLRAGARGYIMKSEGGDRLLKAIRQIFKGEIYVSEKMSAQIIDTFAGKHSRATHSTLAQLTDREFEIFQLIGQGLSTKEIGARLCLSPKTVDTHRLHIKAKLHLKTAPELIKFAASWTVAEQAV
jgi:DNA-binding NarL/FixJ family response regulator